MVRRTIQNAGRQSYKMKEVDEKPQVTQNPEPGHTENAAGRERTARVRIVLRKSGVVSDAEFDKVSPCIAFNDSALEAAKKIKFVPGKKDGRRFRS